MHASEHWYVRRYVILLSVLVLHIAIVMLLLRVAFVHLVVRAPEPVQLLSFPPEPKPTIRPDNPRPRNAHGVEAISVVPPDLPAIGDAPTAAAAGEHGSGVDWNAEARRAVQAFNIRKQGAAKNEPNPGPLAVDGWWPRAHHHVGEQYKTAAGDWIVWIDSECYQIAESAAALRGTSALSPRTICPKKPTAASGSE